ncbi:recombinase XerC [bacterium D16-54]|nr:recombinase XerC [bacterium D16-54]RKJ08970.1 recombinase XerC [bacterium D16-56]
MNMIKEMEQYLEFCKYRKELNRNTLKAYRIDLEQYLSFIKKDFLLKARIEEYITELHKKYKQKTVKRKIASIKAFYRYLEEEERLEGSNPFTKIRVKFKETESLPRIIPRNDIERLLNYMYDVMKQSGQEATIYRDLSVIEMFFATGARVYEISNLKIQDIDLDNGIIKLFGKGSKERYVQIGSPEVLEVVKEYYRLNQQEIDKSGFFFVNRQGKRFSEQSIRRMIRKYSCQAGISIHITPHMFRHSVATYLLEEGVDIMYIQKILGHSSIKTTQIYLHIASKKQMEILKERHPRNQMRIQRAA